MYTPLNPYVHFQHPPYLTTAHANMIAPYTNFRLFNPQVHAYTPHTNLSMTNPHSPVTYNKHSSFTQEKTYHPYISSHDPCPPIKIKMYSTPPNLYLGFQPPNLPQYKQREALRKGVLWPALYSPYPWKSSTTPKHAPKP